MNKTNCTKHSKIFRGLKRTIALTVLAVSPAITADILSVHCPNGCPSNPNNNDLVFGHVYALSNNPKTKFADWVAYEVDVTNFGASPGRNWAPDPLLDDDETLEASDYKKAHSQLNVDRGHQAPLASFAGSKYWAELNYLSNITPQKSELNQGAWVALESAIRDSAEFRDSLFVITGPVFENSAEQLPGADESHSVPTGYFKIIYDTKGNTASFLMPQSAKRSDTYCSFKKSITAISSKLRFNLPNLNQSSELAQRIGC